MVCIAIELCLFFFFVFFFLFLSVIVSHFRWIKRRRITSCNINIFNVIIQASDQPFTVNAEEIDKRIKERIDGELLYLSGALFLSSATLNKTVALS